MPRSVKKGPYIDANLEEKVLAINEGKNISEIDSKKIWNQGNR